MLLKRIISEQINLGKWWTVFFDAAFISHRCLRRYIKDFSNILPLDEKSVVLDVGCGAKPYEGFFAGKYIGMDANESGHIAEECAYDLVYDGLSFPLMSESADVVVCTEVIEHVKETEIIISEIARVLKLNGALVLTAPFLWQEHEKPYDFNRFSIFGLSRLIEKSGLHISQYHKISGGIEALSQALSIYIANNWLIRIPGWGSLMVLMICAPIQIIGLFLQKVLPDNNDLYIGSAVLAVKNPIRNNISIAK